VASTRLIGYAAAAFALLAVGCSATSTSSLVAAAPASPTTAIPSSQAPTAPASTGLAISASASVAPQPEVPSAATPTASSVPVSSPAPKVQSCASAAATDTFLYVATAKWNTDGSLTLTGNVATMVCGGPDDFHYNYDPTSARVTGHVSPGASLQVLTPSLQLMPITYTKFPGYLVNDNGNIRVFAFTGPLTAITSLSERWHP
jgi:hypothetical protein